MIRTYSLRRDGAVRLSPHFHVKEFAQRGTDTVVIDDRLIELLEKLRDKLSCSKIVITCGFRTDGSGSQHCCGRAADVNCYVKNGLFQTRLQGQPILCAAQDIGFPGIGWIPGKGSRAAVHLDTRDNPAWFDEADYTKKIRPETGGWYGYFGLPVPGEVNPYKEPTAALRRGSKGEGVKWVQWALNRRGYACGSVDGIFGANTQKAVKAEQKAAKIAVDGIVGKDTRAVLR